MEKKALRAAFNDTLIEAAKDNKSIMVTTSDARGSVGISGFFEKYPGQSIELGIAEQNSVSVAAGLASAGNRVFSCGPACFLSARSLEQVKVDVAYNNTPVVVLGVSGGISYGALGSTHHSLHDIAVMRTFPGLSVFIPSDAVQMSKLTKTLCETELPAYVRIGRNPVPVIYDADAEFEIGKASILNEGSDILLIACGELVAEALAVVEKLKNDGLHPTLLDMHTIKPLDTEAILKYSASAKLVVTLEEHSVFGGLGAAVSEVLAQHNPTKMLILGLPDENVVAGTSADVFAHYGLNADGIYKRIIQSREEG